jgi:hypothetical protein
VERVEQVEPESAVVYGGGLAWQEFAVHARLYSKIIGVRSDARCYRTSAVYASDVRQFRDSFHTSTKPTEQARPVAHSP